MKKNIFAAFFVAAIISSSLVLAVARVGVGETNNYAWSITPPDNFENDISTGIYENRWCGTWVYDQAQLESGEPIEWLEHTDWQPCEETYDIDINISFPEPGVYITFSAVVESRQQFNESNSEWYTVYENKLVATDVEAFVAYILPEDIPPPAIEDLLV